MEIKKLQEMTLKYKSRHSCGFTLFNELFDAGYGVCNGYLSYALNGKTHKISFETNVDKIVLGFFNLKTKVAFLAVDANGDFYLINKLKNIKPMSIEEVLESAKYNLIVLEWYQTVFIETYKVDLYSCLSKEQINIYAKKGFSCNVIDGLNCCITAYSKPLVRKYSIIIHECLNSSNEISYVLEDKKKKLTFFFKTLGDLVGSELAKQHSISVELVEYIPKITPYYVLA